MSKMWNENTIHAFRALINVVVYFYRLFLLWKKTKKEIVTNLINADFTFVNKVFILKQFSKVVT